MAACALRAWHSIIKQRICSWTMPAGAVANTGRQWTLDEMQAAIDRGPHVSAMDPDAISYMTDEIRHKVAAGQVKVVEWDSI